MLKIWCKDNEFIDILQINMVKIIVKNAVYTNISTKTQKYGLQIRKYNNFSNKKVLISSIAKAVSTYRI